MSTHISTFYSYRGGSGRTLLMANVGALLAANGDRVLLCDFCLTTPGLHNLRALQLAGAPESGLLEWIEDWVTRRRLSDPDEQSLVDLAALAMPAGVQDGLSLLPALGAESDLAGLHQSIPWHKFMVEQPQVGKRLLKGLLKALSELGGYQHILLCAPYGVSDLGGLMTAVLADTTVLVGDYSDLGLAGLSNIHTALQPLVDRDSGIRTEPLKRVLVARPVIAGRAPGGGQGRSEWDKAFVNCGDELCLEVPLDPRLNGAEVMVAINDPDSVSGRACQQLAHGLHEMRRQLMEKCLGTTVTLQTSAGDKFGGRHRGRVFEERVARLLALMGYQVERDHYLDKASQAGFLARRKGGLRRECFLVDCREWRKPVPCAELEYFRDVLNGPEFRSMGAEGMYVAPEFSSDALLYAGQHGLLAVTPAQLEKELFDFTAYLQQMRHKFERDKADERYIPQHFRGEGEQGSTQERDLLAQARVWVKGGGRRLWLVLGDYGTGKSVFFRRLAWELATAALEHPEAPVPIAVDLKEFPNATSLEALLQEHFRKCAAWHGNPEVFLHLLATGRAVLLLDAFDEMGTAALARSTEEQFRQLIRPTVSEGGDHRSNRVMITCRSHFFRDHQQIRQVSANTDGADETAADSSLGQLARNFSADVDEIELFDRQQVTSFLERHLGGHRAKDALAFIDDTYDLSNLARRPVLLEMITRALPSLVRSEGRVNPAGLYLSYTNQWLEDRSGGQLVTSASQRRLLLEHLAFELWGQPQHRIHYRELNKVLHQVPRALVRELDPERVDLELRIATFLTRTSEGHYSFSHKSFREFFYARHLLRGLRDGADLFAAALDTAEVTPACVEFLHDLMEVTDRTKLSNCLRTILASPYRPRVGENALHLAYRFARIDAERFEPGEPHAITRRMAGLIPEGARLEHAELREAHLPYVWLEGAVLKGARLQGAVLSGGVLKYADLSGALLDGADLRQIDLAGAELRGASLVEVQASGACLSDGSLESVDLTAAVLIDANLRGATLIDAHCHAARLARAWVDGVDWQGADLTRATAPEAHGNSAVPCRSIPSRLRPFLQLGHGGSVESAVLSSNSSQVLTVGYDRTARLWDLATGTELRRFDGHTAGLTHGVFSADGRKVLTASHDRTARLWDVESGNELQRFLGHTASVFAVAISHDGRQVLTGSRDNTARIWDVESARVMTLIEGHRDWLTSAVLTVDGEQVLTASRDGSARLWDRRSGVQLRCFEGHGRSVTSALVSPDGSTLLTASGDGSARLWALESGAELRRFEGHRASVSSAVFTMGGDQVLTASADGTARLWETGTGREIRRFEGHSAWVRSAVSSSDGRQILTASRDGSACLWDAQTGERTRELAGRGAWVSSGTLSPHGRLVLTAGRDGNAHLWESDTGKELRRFQGHGGWVRSAQFSPNCRLVLTASHDRTARLWDAENGEELRRFEGHGDWVTSAVFSTDGLRILTAGNDGTARLWEGSSGKELRRFEGHGDGVDSAVLSSDGTKVLTAGSDGCARLWDARSGVEVCRFEGHGGWVASAVLNSDDSQVLTAGHDGTARLWDAITGREIRRFQGHHGWLTSAQFGHDGSTILTAGNDGTARIWEVANGRERLRIEGHQTPVTSVVCSSDGSRVLTTGVDCSARLWDPSTGELLRTLICVVGGWLSVEPNGHFRGGGTGPECLSYRDEAERSGLPTLWKAVDLPAMNRGISVPRDNLVEMFPRQVAS